MKADAAAFEALAQQVDGALRALGVVEPDDVPGEREGGEPTVVALALGRLDGALGRAERPVATRSRPIPLPVTSRRDAGPYAGRSSDRPEFPYRAIWISSVHLGTRDCKADLLIDFMRQTESEYLYLIGDIFDGWRLKRSWYWHQSHNDVVQKILRKGRKHTRVIYVPANHDEVLRDYWSCAG